MEAVILAGGQGKRLKHISRDLPKPLMPIAGKPVIERQIELLARSGVIASVIIATGYGAEEIRKFCGKGQKWNINISYSHEEKPLGNGGALRLLGDKIRNDFLLLNGDLVLDMDMARFINFVSRHKHISPVATLAVHPNSHPMDSDLLETDHNGLVTKLLTKENRNPDLLYPNLANAGVIILTPRIFEYAPSGFCHLERDILAKALEAGEKILTYRTSEYIKDMGTEERYRRAEEDCAVGLPGRRNLKRQQRAIFIDRDGTINTYKRNLLVTAPDHLELLPGTAEAIAKINHSGFLAICVTNQPDIAKNRLCFQKLQRIHNKMEMLLAKSGAYLDDIFFCPHHPESGHKGERKEYKIKCGCRKPETGMLLEAQNRYNIDLGDSFMIGDTTRDVLTGTRAGLKTVLVRTGEGGNDGKYPDAKPWRTLDDLGKAVDYILSLEKKQKRT